MEKTKQTEREIRVAIGSSANVLITGPTGSGKTRLARRIHDESGRRDHPFVAVNLAALHEGTIESELFGHEKGAFTGAERKRRGLFETADGGTVLLDEIGELPLRLQARLLEFLQSRTITPLGATSPLKLNVRVIAATHRNLRAAVSAGEFREDLFHRLRVVEVTLDPISKRPGDLDRIVHDCLREVCSIAGRRVLRISDEVASHLERHSWPGNFRELRNVLEYAVHAGDGPEIKACDLPSWFVPQEQAAVRQPVLKEDDGESSFEEGRDRSSRDDEPSLPLDFRKSVAEFERAFIAQSLRFCGGNVSRTAREIGIPKATLLRRIKQHGLNRRPAGIPKGCMIGREIMSAMIKNANAAQSV